MMKKISLTNDKIRRIRIFKRLLQATVLRKKAILSSQRERKAQIIIIIILMVLLRRTAFLPS